MSRQWLNRMDWDRFCELFEKVEGTTYYDVRELAIQIIGMLNVEMYRMANESKDNICTFLQVIELALSHVIITPKDVEKK